MGRGTVRLTLTSVFDDKGMKKAENALRDFDKKMEEMGGASSLAHKMAEVSTKAELMGARMQRAGRAIADAGDAMTAGITAPLVAVGGYAANAAMQFESSMSRVAGALNDPTANMGRLRQLALDMGESTVFSASEAAAAMEELAKGGLTAAQIEAGALQTSMDLAAAGGMGLADAANAVVQSMGAFGLGAEQSGQAANALAGAASASSADVSDLTQGLSQASAQANSAGWSIQDTTAVLGAFADAGIMGSDAGTSLKTMLQRLSAPTDAAAAMMEELGVQTRDGSGQLLGASEMAAELSAKLGTLSSAEKDAAMQTIFGSDASRAALVMTNLGAEGLEKYTAATNDQEAAQRMANAQMGETERAVEEMRGAVETAAIQLGTALAPAVADAAEAVGDAAEAFSSMDEGTQRMIIGIAGFAAAAGPVLSVGGRLVQFAGSARSAFGAASAKMAALSATFAASKAAAGAGASGLAAMAAGAKGVAASMGLAAKAAGLLKLTVAGLAIAAVARVVGALSDAKTHSENLAAATDGLTAAFGAMADGAASAADGVSGSLDGMKVSAEECMQSQIELADSLSTLWGDVGANSALAESYAATIEQLAGKSNLTAAEQAQLQSAVDGFNQVCGTSISVIDPLNGKLSEQVDAVLAVKDAYVQQAKAQAAQQTLVDIQKQQIENDIALKQAQDELAAANGSVNLGVGVLTASVFDSVQKHGELEQKVSDLTAQQESLAEASAMAMGIIEENAAAVTSSKDAVVGWANGTEAMVSACESAGVSTEALGTALSQVGVSTAQLSRLSDEQLSQLAGSYDGSLSSIVSTLQGFGVEVGAAGAQAGQAWYDGLSSAAQQSVSAAMEVTGMTLDQFAAAAQEAGVSGEEATVEFANGLAANAQQAANAAGAVKD
uniref:phage tail tape measure protein n=1 Tax=Gordonibacter pamelaeae TaxID=471189 RepID=UPI003A8FD747